MAKKHKNPENEVKRDEKPDKSSDEASTSGNTSTTYDKNRTNGKVQPISNENVQVESRTRTDDSTAEENIPLVTLTDGTESSATETSTSITGPFPLFLDILYWICLSPYNRKIWVVEAYEGCYSYKKSDITQGWLKYHIRQIIFWIFATTSLVAPIICSITYMLEAWEAKSIYCFICVILLFCTLLTQTYLLYFLVFKQRNLTKLLHNFDLYERTSTANATNTETSPALNFRNKNVVLSCVIIYITLSIALAVGRPVSALWLMPGNSSSEIPVEILNIWTTEDTQNLADIDDNSTLLNLTAGIFVVIANVCWSLYTELFRDLILCVAIIHYAQVMKLGRKIKECLEFGDKDAESELTEESEQAIQHKNMEGYVLYIPTMKINKVINEELNTLLCTYYIKVSLEFSLFWMLFYGKGSPYFVFIYVSHLMKFLFIFFFAANASSQNRVMEQWFVNLQLPVTKSRNGNSFYPYRDRNAMQNDLKLNPLGLGRGFFHLNWASSLVCFGFAGPLLRVAYGKLGKHIGTNTEDSTSM